MPYRLILGNEAVAQGALDAGIAGAFSYPGTPATEVFEYVAQGPWARDAGGRVSALWSANEKVAYEEALGMSYVGKRALVSMKHVGLNVAADPFVNSALTGVNGGLVLVVADDPGMLAAVGRRGDVDAVGVYVEGFNDLDGQELLRHIAALREAGKVVVFYKAGRTEPGRSAAAGHTAAVAGDYDVCQAAAGQAGALVADTFKEFEQMLELATALHTKSVQGVRIGAISNAGFETVGMADAIRGQRYEIAVAELADESTARLAAVLAEHGLERLVNARNPLDVTPMASEEVYEGALRVLLESDEVDAVVVGIVPLTAALKTVPGELEAAGSLAERLPRVFAESAKPIVAVVDSGPRYDPLASALRRGGLPVFPSADQAMRSLGRYLCHRAATEVEALVR